MDCIVHGVAMSQIGLSNFHFHFGLPQWLKGKESTCSAEATGNTGLIPWSGRSPGGGHGNAFQYSCLENPMDRGAWQATVRRVAKGSDMTEVTWHMECFYYTWL